MAATQPKPAKNVLREMEQVGVMENANGVPTRTNVDKEGSLALEVWIIHVGIDIQGRLIQNLRPPYPVWKAWPFSTRSWCGRKNIFQGRGRKWEKPGAAGEAL